MEQRLSLVTLGVRDLARAKRFYEALGWTSGAAPADDVVFFQAGGMIVALWGRDQLEEDSGVEDTGGWGGVTLAHNARSPAEVDAVIAEAEAAGATIPRHGAETFWGGYSGVFVDPDGHPWEVAHNPHWTIARRRLRHPGQVTDCYLAASRTRRAFSVTISFGPERPQSTTSTLPPFAPGAFHQRPPARQRPSERRRSSTSSIAS